MKIIKNGDKYDGEWLNNQMHGQGRYVWKNNARVYEGSFENGLKHGEGVLTWKSGYQFIGTWESGKLEGEIVERKPGSHDIITVWS